MVVQHNLTAMNSNRMLGITTSSQSKSTEKLSSGYKINRAADDAAGLSISEKMRKQIRGLTQASSNAQDGISAVQTAEGALTEVHDMLQRMNELAVKAANGTNSADDRSYIQDEIDQLITEIDRVAETTKFNETYLLKGDDSAPLKTNFQYKTAKVTAEDYYYVDKNGVTQKIAAGTYVSAISTDLTLFKKDTSGLVGEAATEDDFATTTIITATNYYVKGADGNYTLVEKNSEYVSGETYYTLEFTTDGTVGTATEVSTPDTDTGYVVDVETIYDENGTIVAKGTIVGTTTDDYYKNVAEGILSGADATTTTGNIIEVGDLKTKNATVQFVDRDGNEIAANSLYRYLDDDGNLKANSGLYVKYGNEYRGASQDDVNDLVNKGLKYSTGALNLTLHVGADSTLNNQIALELDAMSAEHLGISKIRVDGIDSTNALNAIETLKGAIQRVSTQRSALGAIQNRLEHTINNLDNVVENTTAAESQIRDTDMATEMVKYSNNNILAQAGQAMLAQANQTNQGVLSLLG